MYVINEETKVVNIWTDTEKHLEWATSGVMGVTLYEGEVEQGYDGNLYAKGFAPVQSQQEIDTIRMEEISKQLLDLDNKSTRSIRAILANTSTELDIKVVKKIEEEVLSLREERQLLIDKLKGVTTI